MNKLIVPVLGMAVACLGVVSARAQEARTGGTTTLVSPRVFLLDAKHIATTRQQIREGDASFNAALDRLKRDAEEAMKARPLSVVYKSFTPPSGDMHDYISQGPYFWPNPDTTDGLPYVRIDGKHNPEIKKLRNRNDMYEMAGLVETLALAYYYHGDEAYAQKAAKLLRIWFLDPETKMNPNLEFAQAIPGVVTGRGIGLIETRVLTSVVDAIGLLDGAKAWTTADQQGMEQWFAQFLNWMLTSKNGRDESAAINNHGTYYDIQIVSFALFLNDRELAARILREVGPKRIGRQITPEGEQPRETARVNSWGYSTMNLTGLMTLARLGKQADIDIWNYETEDGRSMRKAIDYMVPYALGEKRWPHGSGRGGDLTAILRRAAVQYPDQNYLELAQKMRQRGRDQQRGGGNRDGQRDRDREANRDSAQGRQQNIEADTDRYGIFVAESGSAEEEGERRRGRRQEGGGREREGGQEQRRRDSDERSRLVRADVEVLAEVDE